MQGKLTAEGFERNIQSYLDEFEAVILTRDKQGMVLEGVPKGCRIKIVGQPVKAARLINRAIGLPADALSVDPQS